MFFSIIVPCYNVGPAITGLLQSISSQLDNDCELVLVNDGSTDNTSQLIKNFIDTSRSAKQIVFKETPNAGAAKARALGLGLARGEFVFFCDSDDLIDNDFISKVRQQLALHPTMDLMYFSSLVVQDSEGQLTPIGRKVDYVEARTFTKGSDLLNFHLGRGMYTAAVWTFVARRSLIEQTQACFTDRVAHEDHLFTLKVIMGARLIVAVPDVLYRQRLRQGSLTNSRKNADYVIERITAYQEADRFLRSVRAPVRTLYDKWSFDSVLWLLRDNRRLLPGVVLSKAGSVFLASNMFNLAGLAVRRTRQALAHRIIRQ